METWIIIMLALEVLGAVVFTVCVIGKPKRFEVIEVEEFENVNIPEHLYGLDWAIKQGLDEDRRLTGCTECADCETTTLVDVTECCWREESVETCCVWCHTSFSTTRGKYGYLPIFCSSKCEQAYNQLPAE